MKHNIRDSKGRFTKACKEPEKVYMRGFKGFNKGLICRGKQYKENTVFEEPKAEICEKGMHFCANPLDVFRYYSPNDSEYCEVEALAPCKTEGKKSCTTRLRIKDKCSFRDLFRAAINSASETWRYLEGDMPVMTSTGTCAKAVVNNFQHGTVISEYPCSVALANGYNSIANSQSKDSIAVTTGLGSAAVSAASRSIAYSENNNSAATALAADSIAVCCGVESIAAATEHASRAVVNSLQSVAVTTGHYSSAYAAYYNTVAVAIGGDNRVKGKLGCLLVSRDEKENFVTAVVDGEKIKQDVWYEARGGKFVESADQT